MNRRNLLPALALFAGAAATVRAADGNPLLDLLAASAKEKKGVTLYVHGQQISLVVTSVGLEFVEGRNQAQSRIVVRITEISAAAMA